MVVIRKFKENDATEIGILIADTYSKFNLNHVDKDDLLHYLGGFAQARSKDPEHQRIILNLVKAPMVFVAEDEAQHILGVLRCKIGRVHSLFVDEKAHRSGIGRKLCEHFEAICREASVEEITLSASLYAVPFYLAIGYEKAGKECIGKFLNGPGLAYQPMKKILL